MSVRTLGHTAWLETDEHGRFAYSFNETTTTPGLHSVLIHATADGLGGEKTGFADITYRVEGGSGLSGGGSQKKKYWLLKMQENI